MFNPGRSVGRLIIATGAIASVIAGAVLMIVGTFLALPAVIAVLLWPIGLWIGPFALGTLALGVTLELAGYLSVQLGSGAAISISRASIGR